MALTLETTLRDALADEIDVTVNFGVTETGGKLVIEQSGGAEISLHRFNPTAFDAASTGVITLQGTPIDDASAIAGTAAIFSIYDRNNLKLLEGVVAVSGQDLDLSSLVVGSGDTVSLTAFSITVPA